MPISAALLFSAGAAFCLAWTAGLYANACLAALIALWLAAAGLWHESHRLAPATAKPIVADSFLALEGEVARLRAMLDQAPAPFVTVAPDGALRAVNRAAREMFCTDDQIARPPAGLLAAIAHTAAGGRAVLRLPVRPGADTARMYAVSAATSIGAGTRVSLAVLIDVDAQLHAAEAAALRDMLQVLSHEIMNSLTPVTSLVESVQALLVTGTASDMALAREALATVSRRAQGIERFVLGYRALNRLPPPVLRTVSITALLRQAEKLFETRWRSAAVALHVTIPTPDILIQLDADLISQALLNLLSNAAEATLAYAERVGVVTLSASPQNERVVFRVTDNGEGVAEGRAEDIFKPFFTLKPEGTGIGLWMARQIALSHGGTLVLDQTGPHLGATFSLTI